ncbi:MAG TPA: AAA family ATPase [Candidatus Paceibacterota bacterium]|nr:AAA family ATPase [Candidatus Paceibacterota bacterium]
MKVIAGIGIPGSGKTTILRSLAAERGYTYLSPDDIREEISGDARIQSAMRLVWETAYARMREALMRGETVVFDATQYKSEDRRDFIEKACAYGATEIVGVYFAVPLEVAQERNAGRERMVPEHALRRMHRRLTEEPPRAEEGFTKIIAPEELPNL